MKLNNTIKVYIFILALLVVASAFMIRFSLKLSDTQKANSVAVEELNRIMSVAQAIYEHQSDVKDLEDKLGQGNLDMPIIMNKLRECGLKEPAHSSKSRNKHKTYYEDLFKLSLKEEQLKSIVKFLQEMEKVNWKRIKIKDLRFTRDPKNKDVWSAELGISQISPKT